MFLFMHIHTIHIYNRPRPSPGPSCSGCAWDIDYVILYHIISYYNTVRCIIFIILPYIILYVVLYVLYDCIVYYGMV